MFVLFDSVWDPNPKLGKQREPEAGRAQLRLGAEPRRATTCKNPARHKLLEDYVKGVVGRFKDDKRVQVWDLWNEPDNINDNSYGKNKLKQRAGGQAGADAAAAGEVVRLGPRGRPEQPLTSRRSGSADTRPTPRSSSRWRRCSSSSPT